MDTGLFYNVLDYNSTVSSDNRVSPPPKTFSGKLRVPQNSDLVSFQFLAKKNPDSKSPLSIKDLNITPSQEKYIVFTSDFEGKNGTVPLATLRYMDWLNYDKVLLSTSLESNKPISGNNSLRADLKQSDKTGWNILSIDYIPIDDEAYYNANLDISAKDVNQLHSKVNYFDSNKKEIKSPFIFGGRNGTFEAPYNITDASPNGTKYMQLQVWVRSNPVKSSSFLIDNVIIKEAGNYDSA
jgi:hypothetical protein